MLLILHQDVWNWNDATMVLGLPVGLTYHVGLCVLAAVLFFSLCKVYLPALDRVDVSHRVDASRRGDS